MLPIVAALLHGETDRNLVREIPYVRFARRGVMCFFHVGRDHLSTFEARVGAPGFFEAVQLESRWAAVEFRRAHVVPGAPRGWRVLSSDALGASQLLRRGGGALFEDLALLSERPLRVHVTPARTAIEADGEPGAGDTLRLADALERMIDLAPRPEVTFIGEVEEGVAVVESAFNAHVGRCLVCDTSLDDVVASCAACRTPHHAECWTYLGTCSTFGCGCTETA